MDMLITTPSHCIRSRFIFALYAFLSAATFKTGQIKRSQSIFLFRIVYWRIQGRSKVFASVKVRKIHGTKNTIYTVFCNFLLLICLSLQDQQRQLYSRTS